MVAALDYTVGDLVVPSEHLVNGSVAAAWKRDGSPATIPLLFAHGVEKGPTLLRMSQAVLTGNDGAFRAFPSD